VIPAVWYCVSRRFAALNKHGRPYQKNNYKHKSAKSMLQVGEYLTSKYKILSLTHMQKCRKMSGGGIIFVTEREYYIMIRRGVSFSFAFLFSFHGLR
jgi:hypothetical protein